MTLKDLRIKLRSLIDDAVDKELMTKIGKDIAQTVKSRTRKGRGVPVNLGPTKPLPGISESYKKQRARLSKQGKLSSETTPKKSNLTKSGQMLDSTTFRASKNEVVIGPSGTQNKKKAEFQAKAGRVAYNLSKAENKRILKIIEESITDDIKKKGL